MREIKIVRIVNDIFVIYYIRYISPNSFPFLYLKRLRLYEI